VTDSTSNLSGWRGAGQWEDSLIRAIGEELVDTPEKEYIVLDLGLCAAEVGAPNDDAVYRTILDLIAQKLLEGPINIHHVQIRLTSAGWRRYREISGTARAAASTPTIIVNAGNFSGIIATDVSGPTSISSARTSTSPPPANDAASDKVQDKWVNLEYPQRLGLIDRLTAEGWELKWESANNDAASIDIDGWEHVLLQSPAPAHPH